MKSNKQHEIVDTMISHRSVFRGHWLRSIAVSAGAFLLTGLALYVEAAEEPQSPLVELQSLAGSWVSDSVEFLNADGTVRKVSAASAHNEFQLNGNVLLHRGRLADPVIESRGWYYVSPKDDRLHMSSVTNYGRYDEFVGGWLDGKLVMVTIPNDPGDERIFRMTHANITKDSYVESLEVSEDNGQNWRMANRQTMRRVKTDVILDAMQSYTGRWRSDAKTGQDGDQFHFVYKLDWLDSEETIARMRITRVNAMKEESIVFEGYKGLDPDGTVYYHAASPSGRGGRGVVVLEQGDLVTVYDGWTAEGSVVEIRDVFGPVAADKFSSKTYLRTPGNAEWQQIGEDEWSRLAASD